MLIFLPITIMEDDLPEMTDAEYDEWYKYSFVPDGVGCRMGPQVMRIKI